MISPKQLMRLKDLRDSRETYFIADIGSNHNGSLDQAIRLVQLAAEAGANAVKFQHFEANSILNKRAFDDMPRTAHQKGWATSVYQTYEKAETPVSWCEILSAEARKAGVEFSTSPYSLNLLSEITEYVDFLKLGSGDITWSEMVRAMAKVQKPLIIATGASNFEEVKAAYNEAWKYNSDLYLLQCNTNYSGDHSNVHYCNLSVIREYLEEFSGACIGLSDHTHNNITVLGAIALGARVIEKHFTDDNNQVGPDHSFALDPRAWKEMILQARDLEKALGSGKKAVEENEHESRVVQRRAMYAIRDIESGDRLSYTDFEALRPCRENSLSPDEVCQAEGSTIVKSLKRGEPLTWINLKR